MDYFIASNMSVSLNRLNAMIDIPIEKHFPKKLRDKYEFHQWKHACAILKSDFPVNGIDCYKNRIAPESV
jgi:hypothetical protein